MILSFTQIELQTAVHMISRNNPSELLFFRSPHFKILVSVTL